MFSRETKSATGDKNRGLLDDIFIKEAVKKLPKIIDDMGLELMLNNLTMKLIMPKLKTEDPEAYYATKDRARRFVEAAEELIPELKASIASDWKN